MHGVIPLPDATSCDKDRFWMFLCNVIHLYICRNMKKNKYLYSTFDYISWQRRYGAKQCPYTAVHSGWSSHRKREIISIISLWYEIWVATWDFQQCGILTWIGSDEPVQPPFKLRGSKVCSVCRILKRPANALIRLRVCADWTELLLVAHTTLFYLIQAKQCNCKIIIENSKNYSPRPKSQMVPCYFKYGDTALKKFDKSFF